MKKRALQVLEDWEALQDREPTFDIDTHAVDGKPFVRVTFLNGKMESTASLLAPMRSGGLGAKVFACSSGIRCK